MKFKEYSFRDLLINIVDNRGRTCPTVEQGIPLIATNCIKNTGLYPVYEKLRYVSEETYNSWFRDHPKPGDMVFVCKGSPGRVCWVSDPVPFCIAQDMVAIRADETIVYPKYLFALLRSEVVQNQILNMHVGTLIPHFKKGDFANLYLQVPEDMEYQKQVGDVYFSFCEKIENNHQINQTLEQMAQAIFKSWFVDFEPVKAKIAVLEAGGSAENALLAAMQAISGKSETQLYNLYTEQPEQYTELRATAELFPSAMKESELGEIPEGWEVQCVGNILELVYGKALKSTNRKEGTVPVYGSGGITGYHNEALVPKSSIIVGRKGTVGSLYWEDEAFFPIDTTYYVQPRTVPLTYCYYAMQTLGLEQMNTDAAVPGLNRENVYRLELARPGSSILQKFDAVVSTMRKAIHANLNSSKALAEFRDILLPKLLSGELRLPEAEVQIQEAADAV